MRVDLKSHLAFLLFVAPLLLAGCQPAEQQAAKFDGEMVLAISWQAGFCETRPRLPECRSQTDQRFDANHFALHGLWPQPRSEAYCDVPQSQVDLSKQRRWSRLGGLGLPEDMQLDLLRVMPGARSFLHRHEWVKHGTCYSRNAETYYRDSLALMAAINASSVQDLFANNIGKKLTTRQIRAEFDKAFGRGVGNRIRVSCVKDGKRQLIKELTLGMNGVVGSTPDLKRLTRWSRSTKPGCPGGLVDPVGLQ